MSELQLYNTLSRRVEPFVPSRPGEARVYVCGPTVYDVAHAGNARPAVVFDVLVRHLRARGLAVTYVRNITDVDDKILDRARQLGEDPLALSGRFAPIYQRDMQALGCAAPDHEPKVSEHIPEIVALIQKIVANGHGYEATMPDGGRDVYFAVRSFEGYGKLSRRNLDELVAGARVEANDVKRDPLDFALWKGCVGDEWGWDSPWGRGRPGWHIECSAMSAKYLGHGFDLHGGGMDLVFPHHENEIAQSEAAHPGEGPFARHWMHNGFLNVDKEKMSKSLGNFVRPCDVYESNDPEALRWVYLGVQYRGPLGFDIERLDGGRVTFPGVDEAERRIDYLYATLDKLAAIAETSEIASVPKELAPLVALARAGRARVGAALDDDLNTPVALAVVGELAKAGNDVGDLVLRRRKDAAFVAAGRAVAAELLDALRSSLDVLGLLGTPAAEYAARTRARRLAARGIDEAHVAKLVADRVEARAAKDFAKSDALRDELAALGIELSDGASGTAWRVKI